MMDKIRAVWSLTRLEHGFIYGLGVVAGVFISLGYLDLRLSVLGFLTALFLQASAFALNDYFDYEVDLANRRYDRPLVRGELKRDDALRVFSIFAVPGFFVAYLISLHALVLAVLITLVGYIYDIRLKEYGLAGNAYIAFSMSAPFLFGGIVAGNLNSVIIILSVIAFISGLAREIMKGIEDVEGDVLRNVKSVARIYGIETASKISALLFSIAVTLSFIVMLVPEYLDPKYIFPVLITDCMLAKTSLELLRGVEKTDIKKLRKETMYALSIGILAFIFGSM